MIKNRIDIFTQTDKTFTHFVTKFNHMGIPILIYFYIHIIYILMILKQLLWDTFIRTNPKFNIWLVIFCLDFELSKKCRCNAYIGFTVVSLRVRTNCCFGAENLFKS